MNPIDYQNILTFNNNNNQIGGSITHQINKQYTAFSKKFNCSTKVYECKFSTSNKTFAQAHNDLITLFDDLHNEFINNMSDHNRFRIVINHQAILIVKAYADNNPDKKKVTEPNSTHNKMVEKIVRDLKFEDQPLGLE
ncbi:unnamed protein product [Brachionus calyciflorus]|uniref:Uncharacterized protein n=1 Tax=Brachionus calyciflorus TaxID=104777 RepID=A0A813ZNT0_9BILA|nr:unnamed protein product [Brachionus calyciflorus]